MPMKTRSERSRRSGSHKSAAPHEETEVSDCNRSQAGSSKKTAAHRTVAHESKRAVDSATNTWDTSVTLGMTARSTTEERTAESKTARPTVTAASHRTLVPGSRRGSSSSDSDDEKSTRRSIDGSRRSDNAARDKRRKARLARIAFEKAKREMEKANADLDSLSENESNYSDEDGTDKVREWIKKSIENEKEPRPRRKTSNKVKNESSQSDILMLAEVLKEAFSNKVPVHQPKYIHDLPIFDGNSAEWLAFKVVYSDTSALFTDTQNMARLRQAIKGQAREAVKSLLYSEASPDDVMEALRRRFGRTDKLVLAELEKLKTLPRMTDDPRDICIFASRVSNSVAAIKGLKRPEALQAPGMVKELFDKLTTNLKYRWYDYTNGREDRYFSDLGLISKFLDQQADMCAGFAPLEERKQPEDRKRQTFRQAAHTTSERDLVRDKPVVNKFNCPVCQGQHYVWDCQRFLKAGVEERWAMVTKQRLCFKCLDSRHRKDGCRRSACKKCGRWHHMLLHSDRPRDSESEPSTSKQVERGVATNVAAQVHTLKAARAYLKMVPVLVYGPKGSARVLALLDEGSTVSLLDTEIAEQIGAAGSKEELVLETVGGQLIRNRDSQKLDLRIRGLHQRKIRGITKVRTINDLKLTPQFLDKNRIESCPHLKKISNVLYYNSEPPRLLIGQDNWDLIVSRGVKRGPPGQPVASFTYLGWVLHGYDDRGSQPVQFVNSCMHVTESDIHDMLKEHFSIEALGVQPRRPTTDSEGRALRILENTSKRLADGRFEVGLLWKTNNEHMPNSYVTAERRLKGIEKKIDKDPYLRDEYQRQIQHLLDCGYAEEVQDIGGEHKKWYLPHFPVVHPVKKKVRIVFDAAAKSGGKSLNDALLPGPDLLQSLFGVLLRFRQGPLAIAADIKEMFLQVRIRPEDRDCQRFLWRGNERDKPPKEYRMTSVMFGATSSPCTAIFVKNKNASEYVNVYPDAVRAIEKNHYMDDYLCSFHSEDELIRISNEIDCIHRKAGFELRGWASNCPDLLSKICGEAPENIEVNLGEHEEKTLGLRWLTQQDCIGFRATLRTTPEEVLNNERSPTKREVTSAVMSTFDPLGLASPVLIQGKKLLQSIWRSGIGWDDEIEQSDEEAWCSYKRDLRILHDLMIPRCVAPYNDEGEIHIFSDASESAYAAAVYWRVKKEDGGYQISLLAAKARVTPLKPVSVPRLELQAALLGSRLAKSVQEELDLKVTRRIFWSDSSIVLSWIKTDPRTFKTFVAHRLAEIEEHTKPQEWRWVPTALNPADDATRGVPEGFSSEHRWFTGPEFLKQDEQCWPAPRTFKKVATEEEKVTVTVAVATQNMGNSIPDPSRFSSWNRLCRSMARVLQFICKCKANKINISRKQERKDPTWGKRQKKVKHVRHSMPVTESRYIAINLDFLEQAESLLLQQCQAESFSDEISRIKQDKVVLKSSRLRKLDIIIVDKLLRLRGRIDAASGVERDLRHPIVLDGKHRTVRLLVEEYHRKFNHGNHLTVMNEIRQKYYVLGLRSMVRSIVRDCQWCKVHRSTPQQPPTGDLPKERLKYGSPPFTCTAVDYFGPMEVTVGRRREKRWGALFTCLTTRAVHMELTESLSTNSMILALRRMAARRGMPHTLYSDNGTNFVGANKELMAARSGLRQEEMVNAAEKIGVRWKFIPPGAPNMGGAWERLVRSIKTALEATLKERHPREEILHTLLLEAEHVVNSRPLTELTCDGGEEALTPNHFLIGRSCGAARVGAFDDNELVGRASWRTAQRLADHFWQRWLREYLPTLVPRKVDGRAAATDLRPGDIVLVADSNLPRCTWPRGRITATHPGPDGRTRVVDVATRGGVLRRPSSKLVLLVPGVSTGEGLQPGASPSQPDGAEHEGENVGDQRTIN